MKGANVPEGPSWDHDRPLAGNYFKVGGRWAEGLQVEYSGMDSVSLTFRWLTVQMGDSWLQFSRPRWIFLYLLQV